MSRTYYSTLSELYDDTLSEVSTKNINMPTPEKFASELMKDLSWRITSHNAEATPAKRIDAPMALPWYLVAKAILEYCGLTFSADDYLFDQQQATSKVIIFDMSEVDGLFPKEKMYFREFKAALRKLARRFEPTLSEFDMRSIECFVEDESPHTVK